MSKDQDIGRLNKGEGSYYTPFAVAETICDIAGYTADNPSILNLKIIDPAAGDGAILVVAIKRFVECAKNAGLDDVDIARRIRKLFFAYELDAKELSKCKNNVSTCAAKKGITLSADELDNFICGDAFSLYKAHEHSMDFVLGNPPYVRIHNLNEKPESDYVEGMCDLFYPFYDIGQRMLASDGTLCYISPSSWFTARAGRNMREDLHQKGCVAAVCDFGHYQVFAGYALTYTAIVKLTDRENDIVCVYETNPSSGQVIGKRKVSQRSCWIGNMFLPGASTWMEDVLGATGDVKVRNGYATNLDNVFMSSTPRFAGSPFEREAVKASKCEKRYMLYPYDEQGKLVAFDVIEKTSPGVASVLKANKEKLCARTQVDENAWWCFGRSQGIADTFCDKIAVQSLFKPGTQLRTMEAPAGCGVYGGIYVFGMEKPNLDAALSSHEFKTYVMALRKYKSGGYYAFGGKDLERFLNWWSTCRGDSGKLPEKAC